MSFHPLSKKALYDQLTWHGFLSAAMQYAINHLQADYKANALAKARDCKKYNKILKLEIHRRLVSPYDGGFTKEEANYAIQHLGD